MLPLNLVRQHLGDEDVMTVVTSDNDSDEGTTL